MLDIMDTFNHRDIHPQYNKHENHIFMKNLSKKVNMPYDLVIIDYKSIQKFVFH
jgi:hypothetical protein